MGNLLCCAKRKKSRKVTLLLVGLDNAGKSVAAKGLTGGSADEVVPTVGLSVVNLKYKDCAVKIFDLGGGPNIRGIWEKYFVDVHGVIFVIDSSDYYRLEEARTVFNDLLSHENITGKPILLLANKQDQAHALDEIEFLEKLNIEELVNRKRCPTFVQTCSATEATSHLKFDAGIQKGFTWLLRYIVRFYATLNERVERDVEQQRINEQKERREKLERLRKLNAVVKKTDEDLIESYSDYCNGRAFSTSIESKEADIFFIRSPSKNMNSTSSVSNESLRTYYPSELPERPKSSVQAVRKQLELGSVERKFSLKQVASNKTAPVTLFDMPQSKSAVQKRHHFLEERRHLKSAGDSVYNNFIVNDPVRKFPRGGGGEEILQPFHFDRCRNVQKLPDIKSKSDDDQYWARRSELSIVDIL